MNTEIKQKAFTRCLTIFFDQSINFPEVEEKRELRDKERLGKRREWKW